MHSNMQHEKRMDDIPTFSYGISEQMEEIYKKKQIESDLRQIFEQSLPERIKRHMELSPHQILAGQYFAAASAECIELYRNGNHYGCISLTQAVADALVRFLCERNGFKPKKTYEKNVNKLNDRNFLSDQVKDWLLSIWKNRDDYHHLNKDIEQDRQKLEELSKEKIELLNKVEGKIFEFTINQGKLVLANPKYWDIGENGRVPVYLRFE